MLYLLMKTANMTYNRIIDTFTGDNRWLSNFWIHDTKLGMSVEHYYQAAKATTYEDYARILSCDTPGKAKRLGKEITCRQDWDDVKLTLMEHFIKEKFIWNSELSEKLKNTANTLLVEGNTWGDTFWGVCNGEGQNYLGKILMKVRDEFI